MFKVGSLTLTWPDFDIKTRFFCLQLNESLYELYCGSSLFKLSVDWLDSARAAGRQSLLNQTSVHVTRLVGMTGDALKRV